MPPRCTTEVLRRLRDVMKNTKYVPESLQAYIIPSGDAHQSEYISDCDARREFISAFSGSRGTAVVTEKHAAMWTDSRYTLQAKLQMDDNWTLMDEMKTETPTIGEWINKVLPNGSKIGFDPYLVDYATWLDLHKKFKYNENCFIPIENNLIDIIWKNKPDRPCNAVEHLPIEYTGRTVKKKIKAIRKEMSKEKASTVIVTALDEIAWLFNLRGSDISYNPVFFSYAIVTMTDIYLFINSSRMTENAKQSLKESGSVKIHLCPYQDIVNSLQEIVKENNDRIWVNKKSSYAMVSLVPKRRRLLKITPIEILKSLKNEVEINGAKKAHIKDAAALCEYFCFLSREVQTNSVTEISAAEKLEICRKQQTDYVGLSFSTISASGSNAAIVHYRSTEETNRKLNKSEIYLCDSGAQYKDGTTDVTRTWHFGEPSSFEKKCYTLVLKGHIAVSTAVFPKNCKGHRIDSFARKYLWEAGLDYGHGTGHGVGSYLNVHEGPSGISSIYNPVDPGMREGMILSIEPGYYEEGNFGVRLENLAVIKEIKTLHNVQDIPYLTFEPLTLFPFQANLIELPLLTDDEIAWLNKYHMDCRIKVGALLKEQGKTDVLQWLLEATQTFNRL